MNIAVLSLIESILPNGAYFNPYGILQVAYLYYIKVGKVSVRYSCFSINGVWGGALQINAVSWGCSCPLSRKSLNYASFEDCVDDLWQRAIRYVTPNEPKIIEQLQKLYAKWSLLSAEEKFKQFKVGHVYGKE